MLQLLNEQKILEFMRVIYHNTEKINRAALYKFQTILEFFKKSLPEPHLDFALEVLQLFFEGKSWNEIFATLEFNPVYIDYIAALKQKPSLSLSEFYVYIEKFYKYIRIKEHIQKITQYSLNIEEYLNKNIEQAYQEFKALGEKLFNTLIELDKNENRQASNICSENVHEILEAFKNYLQHELLIVETGYPALDAILNGGLHGKRLYNFVIPSGSGKSTLMINLVREIAYTYPNSETRKRFELKHPDKIPTLYYFTLENTEEETYHRLFSCIAETSIQGINDIDKISNSLTEFFSHTPVNIAIVYMPAGSATVIDLISYIEKQFIKNWRPLAIFVDYLLLLRSSRQYEQRRLELGQITLELKNMSIYFECPVISGLQVKKDSIDAKKGLSLSAIKESSDIIDHSDCIIGGWQAVPGEILRLKVLKQRNGASNVYVDFNIDFSKFRIYPQHIKTNFKIGTSTTSTSSSTPTDNNSKNESVDSAESLIEQLL